MKSAFLTEENVFTFLFYQFFPGVLLRIVYYNEVWRGRVRAWRLQQSLCAKVAIHMCYVVKHSGVKQ